MAGNKWIQAKYRTTCPKKYSDVPVPHMTLTWYYRSPGRVNSLMPAIPRAHLCFSRWQNKWCSIYKYSVFLWEYGLLHNVLLSEGLGAEQRWVMSWCPLLCSRRCCSASLNSSVIRVFSVNIWFTDLLIKLCFFSFLHSTCCAYLKTKCASGMGGCKSVAATRKCAALSKHLQFKSASKWF